MMLKFEKKSSHDICLIMGHVNLYISPLITVLYSVGTYMPQTRQIIVWQQQALITGDKWRYVREKLCAIALPLPSYTDECACLFWWMDGWVYHVASSYILGIWAAFTHLAKKSKHKVCATHFKPHLNEKKNIEVNLRRKLYARFVCERGFTLS